jgi:hypothetical protein
MVRDSKLPLPADRFQHVHRATGDILDGGPDDRLESGIDVILRGVATCARPNQAPAG